MAARTAPRMPEPLPLEWFTFDGSKVARTTPRVVHSKVARTTPRVVHVILTVEDFCPISLRTLTLMEGMFRQSDYP